jgi:hypothetical protein
MRKGGPRGVKFPKMMVQIPDHRKPASDLEDLVTRKWFIQRMSVVVGENCA